MSRNYFLTGITELLILTILKHQDSYAYEITKIIQQESLELFLMQQFILQSINWKKKIIFLNTVERLGKKEYEYITT